MSPLNFSHSGDPSRESYASTKSSPSGGCRSTITKPCVNAFYQRHPSLREDAFEESTLSAASAQSVGLHFASLFSAPTAASDLRHVYRSSLRIPSKGSSR